jgi:multiple sugar transport system ATP-binding protein
MAGLQISGLTKVFDGDVRAVDALDLDVADGEFFALLGPSGCGKTTLLRTIAGLEAATSGTITIGGRDVTGLAAGDRGIAMVFQDYALYPHMTTLDNIAYPLKVRRIAKPARHQRAREAGASLSLEDLLDRRPGQLSGGQQQRVALARAIAAEPRLFLFDEPLSNLDARLRLEARTFLKRLQHELGITTVYVTHDQSEALALADRMAVMRDGRVCQVGRPSEFFHRPASVFVASFIGSTPMNLLDGTYRGGRVDIGAATLPLPEPARPDDGEAVVYGIRPEYVSLRASASEPAGGDLQGNEGHESLAGVVRMIENLGTHHLVSIDIGEPDSGVTLRATVVDGAEPQIGAHVRAWPQAGRALLYRQSDGTLLAPDFPLTITP